MQENEYTGLFENPRVDKTEQSTEQNTQQTEQQSKQTTEVEDNNYLGGSQLKKVFDELYTTLQSKVDRYLEELKEIEHQQQVIKNKIIQQYKQTLTSSETDDKIKSIIFKGVK